MTGVTWHGADAYAKSIPGRRLPTEQEWEKAARGIDGRLYPWRGPFKKELCNTSEGGLGGTAESGSYLNGISPYGALDMAGNVWEWTSSDWAPGDSRKVVRGGSWYFDSSIAICAFRVYDLPDGRNVGYGFRCART